MTASTSWPALGTNATVVVADPAELAAACAAVQAVIEEIDRAASRFREDSEISRVNAAGGAPVRVSEAFVRAARCALRAAQITGGDLDPTIGASLRIAGYDRDFALVGPGAAGALRGRGGMALRRARRRARRHPRACRRRARLRRDREGPRSRPGRRTRERAHRRWRRAGEPWRRHRDRRPGPGGGLVGAGHRRPRWRGATRPARRSRCAPVASRPRAPRARRWTTGLHRTSTTSSNPATGAPAREHWRTVSVAAACCVDANIASTTAIIRGAAAPAWLEGAALPARLVAVSGAVTVTAGWPAGERDAA